MKLSIVFVIFLMTAPAAFADWTTSTPGQVTTADTVGIGTATPGLGAGLVATQEAPIHVVSTQNKNTFILVQNATNATTVESDKHRIPRRGAHVVSFVSWRIQVIGKVCNHR